MRPVSALKKQTNRSAAQSFCLLFVIVFVGGMTRIPFSLQSIFFSLHHLLSEVFFRMSPLLFGSAVGRMKTNDLDEQNCAAEDEVGITFHDLKNESRVGTELCDRLIISPPFPFSGGIPQSARVGETSAGTLKIKNASDQALQLSRVLIHSSNPEDSFLLSLPPPAATNYISHEEDEIPSFSVVDSSTELEVHRLLLPEEILQVWLCCRPQQVGVHSAVIHIIAAGVESEHRVVYLLADDLISESLASCKPFSRAKKKNLSTKGCVPVSKPFKKFNSSFKLPQFAVPDDLRGLKKNS